MLPETYQKLTATRHSRNFREAVEIQTVPLAPPKSGEIVIKNRYAGVNASDLLMAAGAYLLPTPVPCDLGVDAVGEVAAVGDDVVLIKPGDAVLLTAVGAGFREYFTTKARRAVPVPQASPEIMSLSIAGLTALLALKDTGAMTSGEVVLVTAAAGGTGQFAVQIAKEAGNHVIGTCGSDEKAEHLMALGCDRVVNYRKESLREVLKAEYPGGVNLVLEGVGGELFDAALDHLANFGRLVTIGFIDEYKSSEPDRAQRARIYYKVLAKNASVRGFNLNLHFGRPDMAEHLAWLVNQYYSGVIKPQIDPAVFTGVVGAIDAVEYLQAGRNNGKVVVTFE
jgi:NADPH-dependent curcumin reductase CurA